MRLPTLAVLAIAVPFSIAAQPAGDAPITILQTTDIHDHANGADHVGLDVDKNTGRGAAGSYARMASYITYVRSSAGHPVVLVDSGDWTMGTFYDLTLTSSPFGLSFLDLMAYDCVTLGNHEFDYTSRGLAQILASAQASFGFHTPIVASNMNLNGNADLAPFVGAGRAIQTTRVQQLSNGVKVGYIGLMGRAAAVDAAGSAPVSFTDFAARYSLVQNLVNDLRTAQGVNVVIVLSHSGTDATGATGEDVDLAKNVTGIDVIASGHTHTPLTSARAVTNGTWTTQIIDAGAYGSSVFRLDVTYHPAANTTTVDASANTAMTDASLAAIQPDQFVNAVVSGLVSARDLQVNATLAPLLTQYFPDYDKANTGKGIYHPVGAAAQDMVSNARDLLPGPNGLGDLTADAIRGVSNALIAQTLKAAGGSPANLPQYDFNPVQLSVVPTGTLRSTLRAGVPLSFADIYNVLPLGFSPDTTQALPVAFPLISGYLELADVKKLCALQLAGQTNLASSDFYLNMSGIRYSLKSAELYTYFKYATAAAVLQTVQQKAGAGSIPAGRALSAVTSLLVDNGASLLALYGGDNPYAGAIVALNDSNPSLSQISANLAVVGQVGIAGLSDAATGGNRLSSLILSKAIAAIDTISAFAPTDSANTGSVTDLPGVPRVRVVADLFTFSALGAVQAQFGITLNAYRAPTGPATLSPADPVGLLANRINLTPLSPSVQELKGWMALLSFLGSSLNGNVGSAYASSSDFTQFGSFGAAVQTRNASYPAAGFAQFTGEIASLQGAPVCGPGAPVINAVTNASYGSTISGAGTIVVWGSGFSMGGGNAVLLSRPGVTTPLTFNASSGSYFWDLSPNQINASLAGRIAAGQWMLSMKNACGTSSAAFPVTIQ